MAPAYRTCYTSKITEMTFQRALPLLILTPVFALALAGCHAISPLTPQEVEGKHLYEGRCAHCHEDNDLALKKVPPNLHAVFNSAKLPSGAPATDVNVRLVVLAGKGMMPAFNGRFDDAQMAALLAYMHTGLR
jgi:mono/diheme cytochrome c family protein